MGYINDGSQSDQWPTPSLPSHLEAQASIHDARSVDSGYGTLSGQTSLRTLDSALRTSFHNLDLWLTGPDNNASSCWDLSAQHSTAAWYTTTPIFDPQHASFRTQTSWLDDTDNDIVMHDIQVPTHVDLPLAHQATHAPPEPSTSRARGHRRSASDKLRGLWNGTIRSLGLAGPSEYPHLRRSGAMPQAFWGFSWFHYFICGVSIS